MIKFWMVYNPQKSAPTFQHSTFHAARLEAERLALANHGQRFFVLEAIGMAKKTDVEWIEANKDGIPF